MFSTFLSIPMCFIALSSSQLNIATAFSVSTTTVHSASSLLKELNTLDFQERSKQICQLAHQHRADSKLNTLVDELSARSDVFSRCMALKMATVANANTTMIDELLLAAIISNSTELSGFAASSCGRYARAATMKGILPELPPVFLRRMIKSIVSAKRRDAADELLPILYEQVGYHGDATKLLVGCSTETVRKYLPKLRHHSRVDWKRLARFHPDVVLNDLRSQLLASSDPTYVWSQYDPALVSLIHHAPKTILDIAKRTLILSDELPYGCETRLGLLAKKAPKEVEQLLLDPKYKRRLVQRGVPKSLLKSNSRRIRLFTPPARAAIARLLLLESSPENLASMLAALPYAERGILFASSCENVDVSVRIWPKVLLECLPHAIRHDEAARMRALPQYSKSPSTVLELVSYCDIAICDVRAELEAACRRPTVSERATGYKLLIESTCRRRVGLTETLQFLFQAKNDQDCVHGAIFSSLQKLLPCSLITMEDSNMLLELARETLSTRDLSFSTRTYIQNLAGRLLKAYYNPVSFQLGLNITKLALQQCGDLALPFLGKITLDSAYTIYHEISPMVHSLSFSGDDGKADKNILCLASNLGSLGFRIEGLQQALMDIGLRSQEVGTIRNALTHWLGNRETRDERVRALLLEDASLFHVRAVMSHLLSRRQSCLDSFLGGDEPVKGRLQLFSLGILSFPVGSSTYLKWLPRQQEDFRDRLLSFAQDDSRPCNNRIQAISILSCVPIVRASDLQTLLTSSDNISQMEAILFRLSHIDNVAESVPVLLESLDGDRARVAMYALRRCLLRMPPRTVSDTFEQLFQRDRLKITVQKEIIRLLADIGTPESTSIAFDAWDAGKFNHRDVKIALGQLATQCLNLERSWIILDELASDEDFYVVAAIPSGIFFQRMSNTDITRFVQLLLSLTRHAEEVVRLAMFSSLLSLSRSNVCTGVRGVISEACVSAVMHLDECDMIWTKAVSILIDFAKSDKTGRSGDALLRLIHQLRTYQVPEECYSVKLPARERIKKVAVSLENVNEFDRRRILPLLVSTAKEIEQDDTLWKMSTGLWLATIDWDDDNDIANTIYNLAKSTASSCCRMNELAGRVSRALAKAQTSWNAERVETWLDILEEKESPICSVAIGHIVLTLLLLVSRRKEEWRSTWSNRIFALREHSDIALRTAALDFDYSAINGIAP